MEGPTGLFTDAKGNPIRRNRFGETWRRVMNRIEFDCSGPHQLRHRYASVLIQAGESVTTVQKRLGHSSAKETLDTYSHLWPHAEETTRSAVERANLAAPEERRASSVPPDN